MRPLCGFSGVLILGTANRCACDCLLLTINNLLIISEFHPMAYLGSCDIVKILSVVAVELYTLVLFDVKFIGGGGGVHC